MIFLSFSLAFGLLAVLHGVLDSNFKLCAFVVNGIIKGRLRNQVVSSLVWLWWVIDLVRFEFESGIFRLFYLYLCSFGESCLLISLCASGRCGMTCSDEDHDRSRWHGAEDQGWSHRSGTRWSGNQECHPLPSDLSVASQPLSSTTRRRTRLSFFFPSPRRQTFIPYSLSSVNQGTGSSDFLLPPADLVWGMERRRSPMPERQRRAPHPHICLRRDFLPPPTDLDWGAERRRSPVPERQRQAPHPHIITASIFSRCSWAFSLSRAQEAGVGTTGLWPLWPA
jgi:hypothetical protein